MQNVHRFALVALVISSLLVACGARAADPVPARDPASAPASPESPAAPAAPYTATRTPLPAGQATALLAPSFQFEGIWMFDPALSDDPMKVMQASRPQGGPGGEGGPGMGRGMGGGMGGGRRGGGQGGGGWGGRGGMGRGGEGDAGGDHADQPAENRPRGPSPMAHVLRPARKLVIEMQADQVCLSEDGGAPRPYALADSLKAHHHELLTENTSARWRNGALELTQALGPSGKLVETCVLSHDGETLTIRARREGGREGMPNPMISRVYKRYNGE